MIGRHVFRTSMQLAQPLDEVFAFFADATNLERITPARLRFVILSPTPIRMGRGTRIDYRLRLFGIPFQWQSRITQWNPPHLFVDEQSRGPYRFWVHTHRFSQGPRGSKIEDEIHYGMPAWPAGELLHPLVRAQLHEIFHYRQEAIRSCLGQPKADGRT